MGQLKAASSHLRLVPPPATPRPVEIVPTAAWWVCPPWCPGDCYGGNTYVLDGDRPGITDCRLHERSVYETQAADDFDRGPVQVAVRMERADSDEDATPVPTDVVLRFTGEGKSGEFGVRLTRAQRRELAAALLNADDLDETPEVAA